MSYIEYSASGRGWEGIEPPIKIMANLNDLIDKYGGDVVEAAYEEALRREANDPVAYARRILESQQNKAGPAGNDKVICEACRLPVYLDSMVVRDGLGVCSSCAGPTTSAAQPPVVSDTRTPEQLAWLKKRDEIEARHASSWAACFGGIERPLQRLKQRIAEIALVNKHAKPGELFRQALGEISPAALLYWDGSRREDLKELGLMPLAAPDSAPSTKRELTATARAVERYWQRSGV